MLQGSMPALITPFKNGAVDLGGLKALVAWHIAEGSHGLVPVGTTGESPTLSHEEHEAVVSAVVEAAAGRIPIVAGAGSNNTAESLRFMRNGGFGTRLRTAHHMRAGFSADLGRGCNRAWVQRAGWYWVYFGYSECCARAVRAVTRGLFGRRLCRCLNHPRQANAAAPGDFHRTRFGWSEIRLIASGPLRR